MSGKAFQAILLLPTFLLCLIPSYSLPLSTKNRWIVDSKTGQRVKLCCVNWPSHVGAMLAEGLHKQPLDYIATQIVDHQFNCVRFTWATYMFTRPEYGALTVQQSFDKLNLTSVRGGIAKNNPFLLRKTLLQAFDAIIDALGAKGIMLVLDNHVSLPIWCCGENDGNGFIGDKYFEPQEWIRGLTTVAQRYKEKSQVVAIGMRNEMRGPNQNPTVWYKYIEEAALKIHQANPDVLVIPSGLSYATDLRFLKTKPLGSNLDDKLVLEGHFYSWSTGGGDSWVSRPWNKVCAEKIQILENNFGFVNTGENPIPLFLGEFGLNQQNVSLAEDHYLSCLGAYLAETDLDWGLWALQGDYYIREQQTGMEEFFGVLDYKWQQTRNPKVQERLRLLKATLREPSTSPSTKYIMFHPQTGGCVQSDCIEEIFAGNCTNWSLWTHEKDEAPIILVGPNLCLQAVGEGLEPVLSNDCSSPQSTWKMVSESKHHLAAKNQNGEYLCLQLDPSNPRKIVTNKCICVGDDPNCKDNPTSQWFKLVLTNVK